MTRDWEAALQRGDRTALARMLDEGADVNALDRYSETSLMRAAHGGRLDVVQLLIERGASLDHAAKHNLTALMLAVIAGHDAVVKALIAAGADLAVRGSGPPGFHEKTALDLAQAAGHARILTLLQSG